MQRRVHARFSKGYPALETVSPICGVFAFDGWEKRDDLTLKGRGDFGVSVWAHLMFAADPAVYATDCFYGVKYMLEHPQFCESRGVFGIDVSRDGFDRERRLWQTRV
jgi:hypothetical protein